MIRSMRKCGSGSVASSKRFWKRSCACSIVHYCNWFSRPRLTIDRCATPPSPALLRSDVLTTGSFRRRSRNPRLAIGAQTMRAILFASAARTGFGGLPPAYRPVSHPALCPTILAPRSANAAGIAHPFSCWPRDAVASAGQTQDRHEVCAFAGTALNLASSRRLAGCFRTSTLAALQEAFKRRGSLTMVTSH